MAGVGTPRRRLAEALECHICFQQFTDETGPRVPLSLPCGHCFCKECVLHLPSTRCPDCSGEFPASVDSIPKNFALLHVLEVIYLQQVGAAGVGVGGAGTVTGAGDTVIQETSSQEHVSAVATAASTTTPAGNARSWGNWGQMSLLEAWRQNPPLVSFASEIAPPISIAPSPPVLVESEGDGSRVSQPNPGLLGTAWTFVGGQAAQMDTNKSPDIHPHTSAPNDIHEPDSVAPSECTEIASISSSTTESSIVRKPNSGFSLLGAVTGLLHVDADARATDALGLRVYQAAYNGDVEILQSALDETRNAATVSATGLSMAAVVNWTNTRITAQGYTPLTVAAYHGKVSAVRILLSLQQLDVNKPTGKAGLTPLRIAVDKGRTDIVRLLLAAPRIQVDKRVDPAVAGDGGGINGDGKSALDLALASGRDEIAELLLGAGASCSPQQATALRGTRVFKAVERGDIATLQTAIANARGNHTALNWHDEAGHTPLHLASLSGNIEAARLLLAAPGVNVNQLDIHQSSPLFIALQKHHTGVSFLLKAAGAYMTADEEETLAGPLLHAAAEEGDVTTLRVLTTKWRDNVPVLNWTKNGYAALHIAVYNEKLEAVRLLVSTPGVAVNLPIQIRGAPPGGRTALGIAVERKHRATNAFLRSAGACMTPNEEEELAGLELYDAAEHNDVQLLRVLCKRCVDAPVLNWTHPGIFKEGYTPLTIAAYHDHSEAVSLLIQTRGIDVNKGTRDGHTALMVCAERGHPKSASLLVNISNLDQVDNKGKTAIDIATTKAHGEGVFSGHGWSKVRDVIAGAARDRRHNEDNNYSWAHSND